MAGRDQTQAFCALLQAEGAAFEGRVAQFGNPNPHQLSEFLRGLVSRSGPLVKACRADVVAETRSGFASVGWDVATNAPVPGSGPPQAVAVLGMLKTLNQKLNSSGGASVVPGAQGYVDTSPQAISRIQVVPYLTESVSRDAGVGASVSSVGRYHQPAR